MLIFIFRKGVIFFSGGSKTGETPAKNITLFHPGTTGINDPAKNLPDHKLSHLPEFLFNKWYYLFLGKSPSC